MGGWVEGEGEGRRSLSNGFLLPFSFTSPLSTYLTTSSWCELLATCLSPLSVTMITCRRVKMRSIQRISIFLPRFVVCPPTRRIHFLVGSRVAEENAFLISKTCVSLDSPVVSDILFSPLGVFYYPSVTFGLYSRFCLFISPPHPFPFALLSSSSLGGSVSPSRLHHLPSATRCCYRISVAQSGFEMKLPMALVRLELVATC